MARSNKPNITNDHEVNPSDNQGAQFDLANVQAGRTWEECEEREA